MIAVVTGPAAAGMLSVRFPGSDRDDRIPGCRHVLTAAAGDAVLVLLDGTQPYAVGLLGTAPLPAPSAPLPEQPRSVEQIDVVRGVNTISPTWTGTYRGGWRDTTDLFQGDWSGRGQNRGAAFMDGLDAVGSIIAATLHLVREPNAGASTAQAPTIALLGGARSSSYPATLATSSGPALSWGQAADWAIPASWWTHLESGTATGFGITGASPYMKLDGQRIWATLHWERTR